MLPDQFNCLIFATALVLVAGCGGSAPPAIKSATMNASARRDILSVQAELDELLKKHSPFVFQELSPPATEEAIGNLAAALDGAKRPFLEMWFKWHDGSKKPVELLPLGTMISVDEAIADRKRNQAIAFLHASRKRDIKLLDSELALSRNTSFVDQPESSLLGYV